MPRIKATTHEVRKAKKGRYSFEGHRGLLLIVGVHTKTFHLKIKEPGPTGVQRTIRLGEFDADTFTVDDAVTKTIEVRNQIRADGQFLDPKILPPDPEKIPTFGAMFEAYCENRLDPRFGKAKRRTVEDYRGQVRRNLSDWLDVPMDRITTAVVQSKLDDIAARSVASAHACRRIAGGVFNFARRAHPTLTNPVGGTKGERGSLVDVQPLKKKVLPGKLEDFWSDIQGLTDPDRHIGGRSFDNRSLKAAYVFALFTGIRSINVRSLTWDQINLKNKAVELFALKNGVNRTMPLADYVVDMLTALRDARLPVLTEGHDAPDLVFPSPRPSKDGQWSDRFPRLPNGTFHNTRNHHTDACLRARLREYEWQFLRGDSLSHEMMNVYANQAGNEALPNMVADEILKTVGAKPALRVVA